MHAYKVRAGRIYPMPGVDVLVLPEPHSSRVSVLLGKRRLVYLVGPAGLRPHAPGFGVYRGLTGLKMYNYVLKSAEDDRELTSNT